MYVCAFLVNIPLRNFVQIFKTNNFQGLIILNISGKLFLRRTIEHMWYMVFCYSLIDSYMHPQKTLKNMHLENMWCTVVSSPIVQPHSHGNWLFLPLCHSLPWDDGPCWHRVNRVKSSCDCTHHWRHTDTAVSCQARDLWPELWYTCGWASQIPCPSCQGRNVIQSHFQLFKICSLQCLFK